VAERLSGELPPPLLVRELVVILAAAPGPPDWLQRAVCPSLSGFWRVLGSSG